MSMDEQMMNDIVARSKYSKEKRDQATELIVKMAKLCGDYPPDIVLLVLESALTETVTMLSPLVGELFSRTMQDFKDKGQALLQIADALQGDLLEKGNRT